MEIKIAPCEGREFTCAQLPNRRAQSRTIDAHVYRRSERHSAGLGKAYGCG